MTDQLDQLKAALAERYAIEREIGSGAVHADFHGWEAASAVYGRIVPGRHQPHEL